MNQNSQGWIAAAICAGLLVLCFAAYGAIHLFSGSGTNGRGGTSNADEIQLDSDLAASTFVQAGTYMATGGTRGSPTVTTSIIQYASLPTCNSASSTVFAVAPPTSATSTATVTIQIGGNATTSSLLIGTSTKSSGLASTDVSPTLVSNSSGISTSTIVWTASGNTTANANAFISAGASSQIRILVKPGEYLVGFSTSTATGIGAVNYTAGYTTCIPKILWTNI